MRREFVLGAVLAAGVMTMGVAARQQPAAPAPMVIEVEKLKDNLYIMKGGGNTYSEFINNFVTYVQSQKKAGKTMDDAIKGWKTPAKYPGYAEPNPAQIKADVEVIWEQTK